jgi:hypothetical protein
MRGTAASLILAVGIIGAVGCASLPAGTPTSIGQVRNGSPVRFRREPTGNAVTGSALGWDQPHPLIVLQSGDTVAIPSGAQLEVKLPQKKSHPYSGATIGWAVGVGFALADCSNTRYCGEENPLPLLGTVIGWFVGKAVKTDWWIVVRRSGE